MTIANGSTILAADLNAAYDAALVSTQAANAEVPTTTYMQMQYRDVNSGTSLWRRSTTFVMPDDMFIDDVSVQSGDMAGTLTVTISSPAMIESIVLTGAVTSPGVSKLTRYFADATKPQQVLIRGSSVTVVVATTDGAGTQTVAVGIGLVSYRRRS